MLLDNKKQCNILCYVTLSQDMLYLHVTFPTLHNLCMYTRSAIKLSFVFSSNVLQDGYRVSFMTELRILFALMLGSKRKYVNPTKAVQV